ncbi:MAG: prophage regulatory protein [Oleiphilaceae bacterium]|jgi:prophage regulatory protein
MNNQSKILRKAEVIQVTGLSNTSIFERTKDGLFPTSISLGGRAVGYLEHEVDAVVTARAAGQCDDQVRHLIKLLLKKRQETVNALLNSLLA